MTEITKEQKEKLKALESDIKIAFKENRFEQVAALAASIKSIDPENHLAVRLLEKMEQAKAEANAKKNAAKIKEYENMLSKQFKDGNIENVRKLAQELRGLDAKSADNWVKKATDAEAVIKRKQNSAKIEETEKQLKVAFKQTRFEEVRALASKLKELDPKNKTGEKFLADIEKAKMEAKRKENADRINAFQNEIKLAFKEARFDDLGKSANKLFEIDPQNSFAKKFLAKAVEAKEEAQKEKAKLEAKAKQPAGPMPVKKEGFFAKLFKKSEKGIKPQMVQPVKMAVLQAVTPPVVVKKAPAAPIMPVITPIKLAPLKLEVTEPAEPTEEERAEALKGEKGNIFTKMFGKKEELEKPKGSIIDTIVARTAEKKAMEVRKPAIEKERGLAFANSARVFLQFSAAFMIISAGFFYVENIDAGNTVLGLFGIEENYASRLHAASETLNEKQADERALNGEITRYKEGYDNEYEKTVAGIVEKRMNWPEVMIKINEIANSIYERNEISQYIKFNSFSFDAESGQVRVSGTLSDPLGKNLTKLAELEDAFRYFPKDKNNPDDQTKPYFYDVQEFKSLSKSFDTRTGKYTSTFQISFLLEEPVAE
jgi:hypothetical protein